MSAATRAEADAAHCRREAIRHLHRAERLAMSDPAGSRAARDQAEVFSLLAAIADRGNEIPDYVLAHPPTCIGWGS